MNPAQIVEAVLFASDAPLKANEIARADESLDEDIVEEAVRALQNAYAEGGRAFQLVEVAEGWQILTLPEFAPYLERFDTVPRPSRVSGPALETLAIIAYRQPIGRVEIEYLRGVSSAGVIRTLQDRGLIDVTGRAEGIGRPLLYGTTARFLEHFGFRSLEDLPRPEELPIVLRENVPLGPDDSEEGDPLQGTKGSDVHGTAAPATDARGRGAEESGAPRSEVEVGSEPVPGEDDAREDEARADDAREDEEGPVSERADEEAEDDELAVGATLARDAGMTTEELDPFVVDEEEDSDERAR